MLARQVIERIAQEVDVAPLSGRFRNHFADRSHQSCMIVGNDALEFYRWALFYPPYISFDLCQD
jgi:hypothetical protein